MRAACGVWASQTLRRSMVLSTLPSTAILIVSMAGFATRQLPLLSSVTQTSRMISSLTNGRATSWTRTYSALLVSALTPFCTDCQRSAPPTTILSLGLTRVAISVPKSSSSKCIFQSAGTAITTSAISSILRKVSRQYWYTGLPPNFISCLGMFPPMRLPRPPAGRTAANLPLKESFAMAQK